MIHSVILRLLHVISNNVMKTTLHRVLVIDGYSKQIAFCAVWGSPLQLTIEQVIAVLCVGLLIDYVKKVYPAVSTSLNTLYCGDESEKH